MEELQEHLDNIANLKVDLEHIKWQIENETKLAKKAYADLGKAYDLTTKKKYRKADASFIKPVNGQAEPTPIPS